MPIVGGSNPLTPSILKGAVMKPFPFLRVGVGGIFNDIDGTTFVKTAKALLPNREEGLPPVELNCMILIPNKNKDKRGQLRSKNDDVYCEVLDPSEVAELKLEEAAEEEPVSNE